MVKGDMNIFLWVLQAILAIKIFTTATSHGLVQSKLEMEQAILKMGKNYRFLHYVVAIFTFLASLGLVLPGLFTWAAWITPLTGLVIAFMLLSSIYFHIRTREKPMIFVSLVLLVFSLLIAWGRWTLFPLV